ncbi:MAG: polyribonucleotide nucleotidyltransferase, partial [Deltaproteobacteria bacterium]|nr:polyribonucleotide nucleotidyltransferase [Deltaproteobacteria bacterium]
MKEVVEIEVGGRKFSLETGEMAKQASGSVLVSYGETVVLVTAVGEDRTREGIDFLPLSVDYMEKGFAVGRIPGGYFRREIGRPSERETLASRLIDRPIRPLFPKKYRKELQVIATVLSADPDNDPGMVAMVGASAALEISDIPFQGPIGAVKVGRSNGELIINPTVAQLEMGDLDVAVAGNRQGIVMVEGNAHFVSEDDLLEALYFAHDAIQPILDMQETLKSRCGKSKKTFEPPEEDEALAARVAVLAQQRVEKANTTAEKEARYLLRSAMIQEIMEELGPDFAERESEVREIVHNIEKKFVREMTLARKTRIDNRGLTDVRQIDCQVGRLPRTHGSGLFTRGETQVLSVVTLGSSSDEQRIESLEGDEFKSFMLHYNFPPYCVGEARFLRGPSRREIGHGVLAERTLQKVLPSHEGFPYTVRV